ncbi:MAG TPA: phosphatidate cytidylyltransferase [Thermoanaerobaculia bacterium]|nr:phosphatidate cytidylyltransferase [Thermoanaerobaculia bacterium]
MKRLLTALVGVPLALWANFALPEPLFFALILIVMIGCAIEYLRIVRSLAPGAPLWLLYVFLPAVAVGLWLAASGRVADSPYHLLVLAALLGIVLPTALLAARIPLAETLPALAIVGFGTVYLALPAVAFARIQGTDPWLTFLLVAIIWLGDTGAFYIGSRWGKHKLAPTISPKKSWEGAIAGFVTSLIATGVWSFCQHGTIDLRILALGAITAVAGQVGDLVESMFKREAKVKDSGNLLPGHGGLLDRMDSALFAAPALLICAWLIGFEVIVRR